MRVDPDKGASASTLMPNLDAGALAHEVNNLLTPTALQLEHALTAASTPADLADAAAGALDAIEHVRSVAEVLLQMHRPDLAPEVCGFAAIGEQVERLFRVDPVAKGIEFTVLDQDRVELLASPTALVRVLMNLVTNAASVGGPSTSIVVTARVVSELPRWFRVELPGIKRVARISVVDTGPGIAADKLAGLFEPGGSERRGGTGLGLYICRQLVGFMRGRISVESTPGLGTSFSIELPAHT